MMMLTMLLLLHCWYPPPSSFLRDDEFGFLPPGSGRDSHQQQQDGMQRFLRRSASSSTVLLQPLYWNCDSGKIIPPTVSYYCISVPISSSVQIMCCIIQQYTIEQMQSETKIQHKNTARSEKFSTFFGSSVIFEFFQYFKWMTTTVFTRLRNLFKKF